MHYSRLTRGIPLDAPRRRERGTGKVGGHGYIVVTMPNGTTTVAHRLVMETILGRPLNGRENVHHINGIKHDNRPENLELWAKPQPNGQRVDDLVRWVVENYPKEVRDLLTLIE